MDGWVIGRCRITGGSGRVRRANVSEEVTGGARTPGVDLWDAMIAHDQIRQPLPGSEASEPGIGAFEDAYNLDLHTEVELAPRQALMLGCRRNASEKTFGLIARGKDGKRNIDNF